MKDESGVTFFILSPSSFILLELTGACSTITWALVPPNPNELTPAIRFPTGQGVGSVTMRIGSLSQGIKGLGWRKCRCGGITPRSIDRITLIRPHTPAAHSR